MTVAKDALYFNTWRQADQAIAEAAYSDMALKLFEAMAFDLAGAKALSVILKFGKRISERWIKPKVEQKPKVLKRFFKNSAFESKMATA